MCNAIDWELCSKVAEIWVDGGGDAEGILWNVNMLRDAVQQEIDARSETNATEQEDE